MGEGLGQDSESKGTEKEMASKICICEFNTKVMTKTDGGKTETAEIETK